MARRTTKQDLPDDFEEHIVETDVGEEMRSSFLEYAYSVIYSRALPDARDGLKPVQRRILYTMADMNLRPDRGHVKCARVVGEVMGRLHPHGDGAIFDALVRLAQPWSMRLPLVDGHGNFGSPDDPPAAMRFVPGPDLPTGGKIVGLDGIREAYETGRGSFRMRATARVESVTPRRKGIVVTELPYNVGPEKVIERIKQLVQSKKLAGISDLKNLTDRNSGLRLVIELKNGFHPEAILEQLYKQTPLEDSFGINAVALVDGQPRTLGLRELLRVYLEHRYDVVRRRSRYRRDKAADRLHLVEGLLIAILDIDE